MEEDLHLDEIYDDNLLEINNDPMLPSNPNSPQMVPQTSPPHTPDYQPPPPSVSSLNSDHLLGSRQSLNPLQQGATNGNQVSPQSYAALACLEPRQPSEEEMKSEVEPELSAADMSALKCVQVMHKSVRAQIFDNYKELRHIMSVPTLDPEWSSQFVKLDWPSDIKVPEHPSDRARFNAKYPGLITELELQEKHKTKQLEAAPNIRILNDLHGMIEEFTLPEEVTGVILAEKEGTIRSCLDALQLQGDHIAKITMARRENFIKIFPHLRDHLDFVKDESNYNVEETRVKLFRKTFLNNLLNRVNMINEGYNSFTGAAQASKKMLPSSHSSLQHRYVDASILHQPFFFEKINELHLHQLPFRFFHITATYLGGRLKDFYSNWQQITFNKNILSVVGGHKIRLTGAPYLKNHNQTSHVSPSQQRFLQSLIDLKIIEETNSQGLSSSFFLIPKDNGSFRFILNLKELNKFILYKKFKMQSVSDARDLISKNDFMVKLDLKQAYDCVPIDFHSKNLLQFRHGDKKYQFNCLPNGLSEAPRIFTMILDPIKYIFGVLGIKHVSYLDDLLIINKSSDTLRSHINLAAYIFTQLGFIINMEKSIFVPVQRIDFLGFVLDSHAMTISLSNKRLSRLQNLTNNLLKSHQATRRELATVLGHMTSSTLAVQQAPLFYRNIQRQVNLVKEIDIWDNMISLSKETKQDLLWWSLEAHKYVTAPLKLPHPEITIFTDASFTGWGAVCGPHRAQGPWTQDLIRKNNINILEILAIKHGLMSHLQHESNMCVKIMTDNKTALYYIQKKGGTVNKEISDIALDCWHWAISRRITLIVGHIPGSENSEADRESRRMRDPSDFQLNPSIFQKINRKWGKIQLDLFASQWNAQVTNYYSWMRQPGSKGVDALTMRWENSGNYAFPPWILIPKVIQKVRSEQVQIILITPFWPKKNWYSHLLWMSIDLPIMLQNHKIILRTAEGAPPQLDKDFHLIAWKLSGNQSQTREFQEKLQRSFPTKTENPQRNFMMDIGPNGQAGVIEGKYLPFQHL